MLDAISEFASELFPSLPAFPTEAIATIMIIIGSMGIMLGLAFFGFGLAGLGEMRRQDRGRRGTYRRM
jgi:hypothetical protein